MAAGVLDALRLTRVHTGAATAAVPALALYMCGGGPAAVLFAFMAGLSHHAWGFSLNEILDLEVDRRAGHLSGKPLVSGRIGSAGAWAISLISLAVSFSFMAGSAILAGGSLALALSALAASTICGAAYDVWSKRVPFMDIFVGAWFALLILSAAAAAGIPHGLTGTIVLVAAASGLHLVFNNMVEGGLKDARTDGASGVRSAAVTLGVRAQGPSIVQPTGFRAVAITLRGAFVAALAVLAFLAYDRGADEMLMLAVILGGMALIGHSARFLGRRLVMERGALLKTFAHHEIGSYALSILAVSYFTGAWAAIAAVVIPVVWFTLLNRAMYGRALAPRV